MLNTRLRFLIISIIVLFHCLFIFTTCKNPDGDDTNTGNKNPSESTWVEFRNLEQYPVTIYSDSRQNNVITDTEIKANSTKLVPAEPAPAGMAFYPTFRLIYPIDKTGVISIPYNGPSFVVKIEANKTNLAPVPKLVSIELNSAYIMLINKSGYSLTLNQGANNEKAPLDGESTVINSGQSAAYDVFPGLVSNYSIQSNTTTHVEFPAELTEFRRGIIYVITYNGTNLTLTEELSVLQTIPPALPENIQIETISSTSVHISWDAVYGATLYRIYRVADSADASYSRVADTATLSWTDTGLTAGGIYYYRISAISGGNMESGQSAAVLATMPTGDIWVNAVTDSTVNLAWNTVSSADSYNVYRGDSENGTYIKINSNIIIAPTFTDIGLEMYTAYYYKISAISNGIENELSDAFLVKLLPAPGNVRITSITDTSITLAWNAVNEANGYSIYRSVNNNGAYSKVNSGIIMGTTFTDTGLDGFTAYYYRVSAISDSIECVRSNTVSITTLLSAPANLRLSTVTDVSVSLEWNTLSGASGYNIYRSDSEYGVYIKVNELLISAISYTNTNLSPNTNYYYKVSAISSDGVEGVQSVAVHAATLRSAPGNVRVTFVTHNSTSLAWNAVNGVSGYNIYRSSSINGTYVKLNSGVLIATEYTDTGVSSYPTIFYYKVTAVFNGGIESMRSDPGSVIIVPGNNLATKLAWLQNNTVSNNLYIIEVDCDENISPHTLSYSSKSGIAILLSGNDVMRTVNISDQGRLFTVDTGVTLILYNNITLKGINNNNNSLVYVNNGGTLAMNTGAKIIDNYISYLHGGGGVYVDGGTFTMNGGEISGNSSTYYHGGGVNVSGGIFTMNGGKITGNTSSTSGNGGGVYVNDGIFTMNGGEISGNISSGSGGGVYVSGTFNLNGGEIFGNTSRSGGGGVYVSGETFIMNGGIISENSASSSEGGGVYISNVTFSMNNGEISGNSATSFGGGGVYVHNNGIFTMNGGDISDNGSGVYVRGGTFTMNDGKISDNSRGGGVSVSGTFTMNSGEISGNSSAYGGGGVFVEANGTFTMSGGEISGNTSSTSGGGVFVEVNGTFTMSGGEISGNSSAFDGGGGVYVYRSGTFTMNDGKIFGNTSSTRGGGAYVYVDGTFTMNGGEISGNTSDFEGGGVYVDIRGTFIMNNGEISGNTSSTSGGGLFVEVTGIFTMSGGVIYGINAATSLQNTATNGWALYKYSSSTAEYGTFSGDTFIKSGDLNTTDTTIRIVNGNLQTN
jgi:fibronectin type 3 domain-containing protein